MSEVVLDTETVIEKEVQYTEVTPADQQSPHRSYLYRVTKEDKTSFIATVIAQSSTLAVNGIRNQFPLAAVTYMGFSAFIMQVNG